MGSLDCFLQAEDGIRDLVRSRGLGDVYKRQLLQYVGQAARRGDLAHLVDLQRLAAGLHPVQKHLSLIHI